ncbi:hypothetical protein [Aromatoleum toluclasticum]|uniref:hypothetical protein n=1 Tax=Aromatoleum toluclasticum TaxID=92003 RepID=UPI0012F9E25E|nr:hypothetical protein [Aromatoleum toluclasticum]
MKKLLFAMAIMVTIPATSFADSDIKQEIIDRCRSQMGKYGASMVKACVDQDIEAVNAIAKYPDKYNKIVARCMSQMRQYGFSMVKACADQDIEAETALSNY